MQFSGSQTFCWAHGDKTLKCSDLVTESWIRSFEVEIDMVFFKKTDQTGVGT